MLNLKTYLKFLSRNKLYTFVSIVGFSVSLMFVIILGLYVRQQLSVDDFQKNKDRIFLIANDTESMLITTVTFLVGLLLAFLAEPFFNNVLSTTLNLAHQFTPLMIGVCVLFILLVSFVAGIIPAQIAGIFNDFKIRTLERDYNLLRMRWRRSNEDPWSIIVKMTQGTDYHATAERVKKEYSRYTGGELYYGRFVDDRIQSNYESVQKMSSIMSAFTLLTIVIMVMGVFAMSLYLIRQKEKEIALRKINGATEGEVLLLLNTDSLRRVAIAFVIACPTAYYAMTKWFENFPYKIGLSWWVFVAAGLAVLFLTLVSVSYMTWKAARANPVDSLKGE